jgi:CTP:molybdopterin cytidylyltransferase MocA
MNTTAIVIPAAGQSRRMRGEDKLLRPIDGVAQLRRISLFAVSTGARVIVTLPPDRPGRRACLQGLAPEILEIADCAEGLAASRGRQPG